MADTKITALTAITTVDPAADVLPIVDVSDTSMAASGTTKKITSNQILGAGGTATLASATITGDLTVDTSTLKVDSANNRVGIVNASPTRALDVVGSAIVSSEIRCASIDTGTTSGDLYLFTSNRLSQTAAPTIECQNSSKPLIINHTGSQSMLFGIGSSLQMTLNSTGLGVGMSPSASLSVLKSSATQATGLILRNANGTDGSSISLDFETSAGTSGSETSLAGRISGRRTGSGTTGALDFFVNNLGTLGSAKMTLDADGNLLVGTTSVSSAFNTKFHLSSDSGTTKWAVGPYSSASNFVISAAGGGGVYLNGTAATSWTSASDERLKDIIEPISNAIAKVGSLRAVIGKFKFDQNNTRKPFLIAQDIQAVLPEAVDASNPEQLGVAYTEVIPLLVAAIKELTARVQTLETR